MINCYSDSKEYDVGISIPENVSGEVEDKIVPNAHNKIRKTIGFKEIKEW